MNRSLTRKVTMGHFAHTKALDYANNPDRIKRNRSLIRPIKDIFLEILPNYNKAIFNNNRKNKSFNQDAISLIGSIKNHVDLLYLDPPYCGSHADYQSFYHLLETYTQYWKDKEFKNSNNRYFPKTPTGFETKKDIISSFEQLFAQSKNIPYWLISYNDRSFPTQDTMISLINQYKNVEIHSKVYDNDVGGKGSVKGSRELLFVCF
jgi:adenine-specific DNA methylase